MSIQVFLSCENIVTNLAFEGFFVHILQFDQFSIYLVKCFLGCQLSTYAAYFFRIQNKCMCSMLLLLFVMTKKCDTRAFMGTLKCVCSYLSRDIRANQLEHTLLRVPIKEVTYENWIDHATSPKRVQIKPNNDFFKMVLLQQSFSLTTSP